VTDVPTTTNQLADLSLLGVLDEAEISVPRGEARRRLADVVHALLERAPYEEAESKLAVAAESLWSDEARAQVAQIAARTDDVTLNLNLDLPAAENPVALALAYSVSLPLLARDERVQAPLQQVEPTFAELDDEERDRLGPVLARAATPALPLDLAVMADEGYQFVAIFPPEGSEGVDIVGKAAKWLTKRMTMEGDAPRVAMRRFLALLAEEVEVELPAVSATLDRLLAEPAPPLPAQDRLFVALARGLVEDAVAERGFPF
jgi:hypothetical protein